ncbi:MAG: C45 family peptidase [Bacillota bacterium]|nr:C45 family peptidase [Bacillota bacterium]
MRRLGVAVLLCALVLQIGCGSQIFITKGSANYKSSCVAINDKGNYYDVVIDYSKGLNHKQVGEQFAKGILKVIPDYEEIIDSYIAENIPEIYYEKSFQRVEDIKPQLKKEYIDEIEGMAEVFSGGKSNVRMDKKLSKDEVYLFNLFLDVVKGSQCSFVSVYGSRSSTNKTITGRSLDWYGGDRNQLPRIQAVITIKNPGSSICSIGYMGFLGVITGFNDSKVFAAIQESPVGTPYESTGKRSYALDLREGLENKKTLNEAAEFMMDSSKQYAANHLIVFSDPTMSKVLENNISGVSCTGGHVKRALRSSDSKLNSGIDWGIKDAIACVNSFLLYGNHDNHTINGYNTRRWQYIKEQFADDTAKTPEDIKKLMSYCNRSPSPFSDTKYLYNKATLNTILFQPDTLSLEVYFFPRNTLKVPVKPTFEKIKVF